jgi:hypothetical protein
MYLLNTTFLINPTEYSWWAQWMKQTYIPQIEKACNDESLTSEVRIFKFDNQNTEKGELTFSCQWLCESISALSIVERLNRQLTSDLVKLKDENCLSFTTLMKETEL